MTDSTRSIREVEWLPPLLERRADPDRFARIREREGRADSALGYFLASDWMPEANAALNGALFARVHLEEQLADLVGLAVSRDNSCRYCFAATRTLLFMVGVPRDRIVRMEQDLAFADLDERTTAAVAFARKLSRSNPSVASEDVERLRRVGIEGDAYRELASLVCLWVYFNRVSTIAAMPPEVYEEIPDRWLARLARPFIGPAIGRKFRRRGQPVALPAAARTGPCAKTVNALDGLPVAPVLRRVIDSMWASKLLAKRTRGLLCVTIAKALDCPVSEAEAVEHLLEAGVDRATIDGVLTHLDAPSLTDAERTLVRFARETVWYEPAPLQRRSMEVRTTLGETQFVEAIGTTALANTLCRLTMALAVA